MRALTRHLIVFSILIASYGSTDEAVAQEPEKIGNNVVLHIGIVVRDIEKSARAYAALFGLQVPKISLTDAREKTNMQFQGKPAEGRAKLVSLRLENITVELIEPGGGPSAWREFLDKKARECTTSPSESKGWRSTSHGWRRAVVS